MKKLALGIAVIVVGLVGTVSATATTGSAGSIAVTCTKGTVAAKVSGKKVCLKVGQPCKARLNAFYRARGFVCVSGHLRKKPKPAPTPTPMPTPPPPSPSPAAGPPSGPFTLTSPAFAAGGTIPTTYTCDGAFSSPPLTWANVPEHTESVAVMLDDPDAPDGVFTHWILYNIPWKLGELAAGAQIPNTSLGLNDIGNAHYFPPCPPERDGPHHYIFHLYALNSNFGFDRPPGRAEFLRQIAGGTLGEATLTVTYDH